jgi:hypothetical protein
MALTQFLGQSQALAAVVVLHYQRRQPLRVDQVAVGHLITQQERLAQPIKALRVASVEHLPRATFTALVAEVALVQSDKIDRLLERSVVLVVMVSHQVFLVRL